MTAANYSAIHGVHGTDHLAALIDVEEQLSELPTRMNRAIRSVVDTVQECRDELADYLDANPTAAASLLPTLTKLRRLARQGC